MRLLLLLACGFAVTGFAEPNPSLLADLQKGGYVLYLRHASTDFSQNDSRMTSYADCANQRNLTERGREEARALGEHVKRLKIPIGEVLASPFCRTMETARLAFGKATPMKEARGGPASDDDGRYAPLRQLMGTKPASGTNTVISSHGNPFHAVAGPPYLAEGEIAVVRPEGDSRFTIVARIRLQDWPELR